MSERDITLGLNCPKCGGMIRIPEGQRLVICPYCQQRSIVRGERGVLRFQVPVQIDRSQAEKMLEQFLRSSFAIARNAPRQAKLEESFLVFLPFFTSWGRVLGWVFGQERVGSGSKKRYKPREVQFVQDTTWNTAACDVGEFGVESVPLEDKPFDPYNDDEIHRLGMVFEPVGSLSEALQRAEEQFQAQVREEARLDRISQVFVRIVRRRFGLVFYPLWILRYLYRERAYQVAIDGHSGQILYGKAPGNTLYRAAVLVGGMALGALIAFDIPTFLLYFGRNSDDLDGLLVLSGIALLAGLSAMYAAYLAFRYGEEYEYRWKKRVSSVDWVPQQLLKSFTEAQE
jgi:DNA-directed RNA polymerase subunit RPC12/RpoP